MIYDKGNHQLDEDVILDGTTYQVNGSYTNTLDYEETDDRSNVIVSEDVIIFEIDSVYYGDDFGQLLTDLVILKELDSKLYDLL